jgi:hypothetical protein
MKETFTLTVQALLTRIRACLGILLLVTLANGISAFASSPIKATKFLLVALDSNWKTIGPNAPSGCIQYQAQGQLAKLFLATAANPFGETFQFLDGDDDTVTVCQDVIHFRLTVVLPSSFVARIIIEPFRGLDFTADDWERIGAQNPGRCIQYQAKRNGAGITATLNQFTYTFHEKDIVTVCEDVIHLPR